MKRIFPIRYSQAFLLLLAVMGFYLLLVPGRVAADYSTIGSSLPDSTEGYTPYIHLSDNTNDPSSGKGAYNPYTAIKVYTTTPGDKTLELNFSVEGFPDCSVVTAKVYAITDSTNTISSGIDQGVNVDPSRADFCDINVPGSRFQPSDIPGRAGVYVAMVQLKFNLNVGHASTTFRAEIDPSQARIGIMGVYPNGGGQQDANFPDGGHLQNTAYSVRGGDSGGNYDVELQYKAPCTFFGSSPPTAGADTKYITLSWKDADSNQPVNNGNPVFVKLTDKTTGAVVYSANATGLDNIITVGGIPVVYNHLYSLKFTGMDKRNGIIIWSPFDTAGSQFSCQPPPPTPVYDSSCANFQYDMARNSHYRFDVFAVNDVAPAYSPPGIPGSNSWATFPGQAPVSQTLPYISNTTSSTVRHFQSFPAPSASGWFVLVEHEQHNSDGSWTYHHDSIQEYNCFAGSCYMTMSGGGLGGNNVVSNSNYTAGVHIDNTGRMPILTTGWGGGLYGNADVTGSHSQNTTVNGSGGPPPHSADYSLSPDPRAPTPNGVYSLGGSIYFGSYKVANCTPAPVNVYEYFNINPYADSHSYTDSENPSPITYHTGGDKTQGPTVTATTESWLTWIPFGGSPVKLDGSHFDSDIYGAHSEHVYSHAPPSIGAGDQYCAHARITPASGYVGPGGVLSPQSAEADEVCNTVHNEPYVHLFGADVVAGGKFDNETGACSTSGGIKTFATPTGTTPRYSGSGVQIGALSVNSAYGFSSALLKRTTPWGPSDLTFANNQTKANLGPHSAYTKGDLAAGGGTYHCKAPDYFSSMPPGVPTSSAADGTADLNAGHAIYYDKPGGVAGGTLTISGGTVGLSTNTVMYVDGNVHITGDIKLDTGWSSLEEMPSLYIIARGGSITIDNGVHQLDGVYVSQPTGAGAGGNIYTCSDVVAPNGAINYNAELSSCRSQLVVNGAFIGKSVYLLRSFGSVRDSSAGERYQNGVSKTCSDSGSTGLGDCAGEIFNFSPELYLQQPSLHPTAGPTTGIWDYVTSLAPVL